MNHNDSPITPFLKWPGGKRWFISKHAKELPKYTGRYIEPFLGSGAVFFHIRPDLSIISDSNSWLINTYKALRDDWQSVEKLLEAHQKNHSKSYYYKTRSEVFSTATEQAAQLLYLNRTCWNGLFRVNLKGHFNVPIGTKDKVLMDDNFEAISNALKKSIIFHQDFEKTINLAEEGDLVFADPPYTVKHNLNGFIKYNEKIFSWGDQERLFSSLLRAKKRGAHIVSTNANHSSVRDLYSPNFHITEIPRHSVLAGKKEFRTSISELLIR